MKSKPFNVQDYMAKNKFELGSIKKEVGNTTYKGGHNDLRKTSYDVNIKDGKFQLDTHKTVITESKGTVNETGYNDMNGYIGITGKNNGNEVPFTKETIEALDSFFKKTKEPKISKQFDIDVIVRVTDTVNGGIVDVDLSTMNYLRAQYKKHKNRLASDNDFR